MKKTLHTKRKRVIRKVRGKISGTGVIPRIAIYRSNKYIYAQVIDDEKKVTLCAECDKTGDVIGGKKITKSDRAKEVGTRLGEKMKKIHIERAVLDRRYYKYAGRLKILTEAVRKSGITI